MLQIKMYLKVLDKTTAALKRGQGGNNSIFFDIRLGVPFNFVWDCSSKWLIPLLIVTGTCPKFVGGNVSRRYLLHIFTTDFPLKYTKFKVTHLSGLVT